MSFCRRSCKPADGLAGLHFGVFSLGVIASYGANRCLYWGRYWAFGAVLWYGAERTTYLVALGGGDDYRGGP
ncbi:MAG: hypothetical protein U0401_12030 [Anaerolineae bacterium]